MQTLCDVNLLLALVYARHAHHAQAARWVDDRCDQEIALCRVTQLGLLRLLSNATVMQQDTCTHENAWRIWDSILGDGRFMFVHEPNGMERFLRQYTKVDVPSPKLWQDAYMAAFCRSASLQIATFDRGFRRFPDLEFTLID